jgi:hypothetical protein
MQAQNAQFDVVFRSARRPCGLFATNVVVLLLSLPLSITDTVRDACSTN